MHSDAEAPVDIHMTGASARCRKENAFKDCAASNFYCRTGPFVLFGLLITVQELMKYL